MNAQQDTSLCVYSRHGRRNTAARQWPRWHDSTSLAPVGSTSVRGALQICRHGIATSDVRHSQPPGRKVLLLCCLAAPRAQHRAMTAAAGQEHRVTLLPWAWYWQQREGVVVVHCARARPGGLYGRAPGHKGRHGSRRLSNRDVLATRLLGSLAHQMAC